MTSRDSQQANSVGLLAGTLSLTELGLGSLLHALHVPLTGSLLSLNQGLFLSRITRTNSLHKQDHKRNRTLAFEVSSVTALLKSMSPVGKRLTPMLAIAVQGFLFTVGILVMGENLLGVIVGSMLLATWGMAQPAILAGIMFTALTGTEQNKIIGAWQKMIGGVDWFSGIAITDAIAVLLLIKCSVAFGCALFAWYSPINQPNSLWAQLERRLTQPFKSITPSVVREHDVSSSLLQTLTLALRDLKNPMLWLSLSLLVGFSYFLDSEWVPALWIGMRSLAAVYAFYIVLRLMPWSRILNSQNKNAVALRAALSVIQQKECPPHDV